MATKKKSSKKIVKASKHDLEVTKRKMEKKRAKSMTFESILINVEKSKQKILNLEKTGNIVLLKYKKSVANEQLNLNRFNRYLKYKREQIG